MHELDGGQVAELLGDVTEHRVDLEAHGGQRQDANHGDQAEGQTILNQRLPLFVANLVDECDNFLHYCVYPFFSYCFYLSANLFRSRDATKTRHETEPCMN